MCRRSGPLAVAAALDNNTDELPRPLCLVMVLRCLCMMVSSRIVSYRLEVRATVALPYAKALEPCKILFQSIGFVGPNHSTSRRTTGPPTQHRSGQPTLTTSRALPVPRSSARISVHQPRDKARKVAETAGPTECER